MAFSVCVCPRSVGLLGPPSWTHSPTGGVTLPADGGWSPRGGEPPTPTTTSPSNLTNTPSFTQHQSETAAHSSLPPSINIAQHNFFHYWLMVKFSATFKLQANSIANTLN